MRRHLLGLSLALAAILAPATGRALPPSDSYSVAASASGLRVSLSVPAVGSLTGRRLLDLLVATASSSGHAGALSTPMGCASASALEDSYHLASIAGLSGSSSRACLPGREENVMDHRAFGGESPNDGPLRLITGATHASVFGSPTRALDAQGTARLEELTLDHRKIPGLDLENLFDPILDQVDSLVIVLNGLLATPESMLRAEGVETDLSIPTTHGLASKPILIAKNIEALTATGEAGAARTGTATARVGSLSFFGDFIRVDNPAASALATIDGTADGVRPTTATQNGMSIRVGGNNINIAAGSITVAGHTIILPSEARVILAEIVDLLGLDFAIVPVPVEMRHAGHGRAVASFVRVTLAPHLPGEDPIFVMTIDGPSAAADIRAGGVVAGTRAPA